LFSGNENPAPDSYQKNLTVKAFEKNALKSMNNEGRMMGGTPRFIDKVAE